LGINPERLNREIVLRQSSAALCWLEIQSSQAGMPAPQLDKVYFSDKIELTGSPGGPETWHRQERLEGLLMPSPSFAPV
jgi:hypothetical protein